MTTVELLGRADAVYCQNSSTMKVDGELMASGHERVLYRASAEQWHDEPKVSGPERKRIIGAIVDLLAQYELTVIVE